MNAALQMPAAGGTHCTLREDTAWSRLAVCHLVACLHRQLSDQGGNNSSAVSDLQYLEQPVGRGWGNHPDIPHRHTPNAVDKDNHSSGREGCFLSRSELRRRRTLCSETSPPSRRLVRNLARPPPPPPQPHRLGRTTTTLRSWGSSSMSHLAHSEPCRAMLSVSLLTRFLG